jgi:hypothetical protein
MEQIYINIIIFAILFSIILWIHNISIKNENFKSFNFNDSAPIPFLRLPPINYYSGIPTGYDSGTRGYYNPYFAQQVAQGLDTD